jgi:uncharacterized glyoxalase superfamily protein PhnB
MLTNRSIPAATVIPVLTYADLDSAVAWLCDAFGFAERLRIGDHRAQLTLGTGAIVVRGDTPVTSGRVPTGAPPREEVRSDHSIMVRVEDVDAHCTHAEQSGARIVQPPTDYPYGERQYSAVDPGGHAWTFSQSIADVHPTVWGGVLRARENT